MYVLKNIERPSPPYAFVSPNLTDVQTYLKESVEPTLTTELQKAYIQLTLSHLEAGNVETVQNLIANLGFVIMDEEE